MGNEAEENTTDKTPKKKINGLLIVGIILLVAIVTTYREDVPSVMCNDETLASKPEVIMFATWWCPYCKKARHYFHNNNISYCEYDIEKSVVGKERYDALNASAIPALIIGKYVLQGFSETQIDKALRLSRENNESRH